MSNELVLSGTYEKDLEVGSKIREAAESLQFMLGDWVNEMHSRYEQSQNSLAKDLSAVTGVAANTLREYARVSKSFPPARRLAEASWSHHQAAAESTSPTTTLRSALKDGLSVRDTKRLAKGLPLGGESTATQQSSAAPARGDVSLEEIALADMRSAKECLKRVLETINKPGFRMTVPVGQSINDALLEVSKPFIKIEDKVKDEVGAYL